MKAHISVCGYVCMWRWRYNEQRQRYEYAAHPNQCVGKNLTSLFSLSLSLRVECNVTTQIHICPHTDIHAHIRTA